jgi:excisionase family DNA binding protein
VKAQPLAPVPRVALTREEAAACLGMSLDTFERYVQPELPIIHLGRVRLIAMAELQDWARRAGERALG